MTLGRNHRWWLAEFARAFKNTGSYSMGIDGGYFGTPYGDALNGLIKRGLVRLSINFEALGLFELTPEGIKELETAQKRPLLPSANHQ